MYSFLNSVGDSSFTTSCFSLIYFGGGIGLQWFYIVIILSAFLILRRVPRNSSSLVFMSVPKTLHLNVTLLVFCSDLRIN